MPQSDLQLWRTAGLLLLAGGVIFWIGAFTPPYKQWMTRDIREYLTIIHDHKINWYFIAGTFVVGIVTTLFGMQLFSTALQRAGQTMMPQIAFAAFAFGATFWLLNIAFRATVTVWASDQLVDHGAIPDAFQTWMDWTNLIFSFYMVLAYFSAGCIGYSLLQTELLPAWVAWTCMAMGFGGALLYPTGFPLFAPPLMVHAPFMIAGVVVLVKM